MFLNVSGKKQSLQNKFFEYSIVSPNEIISEVVYPDVKVLYKNQFKKIKKINTEVNNLSMTIGFTLAKAFVD